MSPGDHAAPGDTLDGRYALKEVIGQGGMGQVFRGEQINLGRTVAIKVLHTRLEDRTEEYEARFRREALAASRLGHPNIVQIVDYGRDPRLGLYLVMEFLVGHNLAEIIAGGPSPSPERSADILGQTLAALEAAHAAQILHRDIKPANIMACDVPGRPDFVKVLDFGIARALDGGLDDLKLTRAGTVCGTPTYMAPEQAMGKPLDGRADLYAVGTILYEMLTGHLPFDEVNPMDYLVRKVQSDAPAPDVLANGRDVPPALAAICARGIARDPDLRYPDAAAFRIALEQWLRGGDAEPAARRAPRPAPAAPPRGGERLEADTWAVLRQQDGAAAPELTPLGPGAGDADPFATAPGAAALRPAGPSPTGPPPAAAADRPYPPLGERLVGRDTLLDELADALDQTEACGWSGWLLEGPRGAGRSRVLAALAAHAGAAGWELTFARPTAPGGSPFLVPGDLLAPPRDQGPRLVLVDDLDLFAEPLQAAFYTATYFQDRPTLVCATAATARAAPVGVQRRPLPALTAADRQRLIGGCLGDVVAPSAPEADFPAWLQQRLQLDVERDRLAPDEDGTWRYRDAPPWAQAMGSSTEVEALVRDRVGDLPPTAQRLLRLLALSPLGLERDGLSHLELDRAEVDAALEQLARRRLVEARGLLWQVGSRSVGEALRAQIRPHERGRLYAELSEIAARAAGFARGVRRRQLHLQEAALLEAGDQPGRAADRLAGVADLLRWIEQPERAVAPLRHALALSRGEVEWTTREIRLTASLADALTATRNPKAAWELLEAIEIRPRLDAVYRARVALSRARALAVENLPPAVEAFEQAVLEADEASDRFLAIAARLSSAAHLRRRRDRDGAARLVDQAAERLQRGGLGDAEGIEAGLRLARALAKAGDREGARARYRAVREDAERLGVDHGAARARLGLAGLLIERGDPKGAGRHLDAVRSDLELEPVIKARAALNAGLLATILRDPDGASACHREALGWSCAAGWAEGIRQASATLGRG